MTKLEKVISGLKNCQRNSCNSCPYANDDGESPYRTCRQIEMLGDAIELLKEREPVKPKEVKLWYTEYACGYCDYKPVGRKDGYKMHYCPCCGKKVDWDDEA